MKQRVFTESSIEDSYIYKSFNSANSLQENLIKYLRTGVALDTSYFEEQYVQMKKFPFSPITKNVMDAFENGDIEILYSREAKVSKSLPFIIRRGANGKIIATIFIASVSALDKGDNLTIPVRQLYALMESAYVALEMQKNQMKIQRNVGIMRICKDIYAQMMLRIFNRLYNIALDRTLYDKVHYCIAKFFLTNVWEYPSKDTIEQYAKVDLKDIDSSELSMLQMQYDGAEIKNFEQLVLFIKTLSPRMADLSVRYFIQQFINMYHGGAIMAVDYLPYVFYVIINVKLGSFLIGQGALTDIVKNTKNTEKFYTELAKIV
jgi:flagellin-specific chaperone FliS